jgi:iron complex outermembrane receptor protein
LLAVTNGQFVSTCQVRFRSSSAPPWGANVQAEYSLPMLNDAAEGFIRGLASYNGSADNDPQNFFDDYGAYARLNLYAGLRDPDGAWEVTVFGKNIFDDNTVLATSNGLAATTIGATQVVSPGGYIGLSTPSTPGLSAPREFGVTARFAFGSR